MMPSPCRGNTGVIVRAAQAAYPTLGRFAWPILGGVCLTPERAEMTFFLRAKLTFWRFIALFEGRFGPHALAVVVLTLGVGLVAAGLALAEAAQLLPPPEPISPDVRPPPSGPRPGPGAAESFLTAMSLWSVFVIGPVVAYHLLTAFLEDLIDEAASQVFRARVTADV